MSRGLAFWNDATIQLIQENFVAAAVPTWVCRAKTPEGEFLRDAGIDKQWVTSSGYMSCVSASGKMLGYAASPKVLEAFKALPESERGPGKVQVLPLDPSQQLIPSPPPGGLVLKVHARFLTRDASKEELRYARVDDFPLMAKTTDAKKGTSLFLQPNTEYLWLKAGEWKSLLPAEPVQGRKYPVHPSFGERLARFHLTPRRAMTSEGGILGKADVKAANLELVVDEVAPERLRLRMIGFIRTGAAYEAEKATSPNGPLGFGFQTPIHGVLDFDRTKGRFERFDIVALGEVWGRWGDANGKSLFVERPGRTPFGFALELSRGDSPTERIPPGGNPAYISQKSGYFSELE